MKNLTVFCGASSGSRAEYSHAAKSLGLAMADRNIGLVYGGASTGLMGAVANATLGAGGSAIGVMPEGLVQHEVSHGGLTELHIVPDMHSRKAMMAEIGDGFVTLPGGFGTAEEFFEVVTWMQLGFHSKPIGILNIEGYFDGLLEWLNHSVSEGFIGRSFAQNIIVATDPYALLDKLPEIEQIDNLFVQRKQMDQHV